MQHRIIVAIATAALVVMSLVTACGYAPATKPVRPTSAPASANSAPPARQPARVDAKGFGLKPWWSVDFSKLTAMPLSLSLQAGAGSNNEAQYYTEGSSNAFIRGGKLVIQAKRQAVNGYKYTSARITSGGYKAQYGKIVWKDVTLPVGAGTWPALWLWPAEQENGMPAHYSIGDGVTPNLRGDLDLMNGEIDVMEYVGAKPNAVNCSAHAYLNHPGYNERSGHASLPDATQPHDYWLEWTPASLAFGIDGNAPYYAVAKAGNAANWPYDQPYFIVMNLAMGGDWGGMMRDTFPPDGIDPAYNRWKMTIGAIEWYPYIG